VLERPWDAPPPPEGPILELRRGRVAGTVQIDRAGVRIERAQVRVGAGALAARGMLHFDGDRGFEIAAEGGATTDWPHRLGAGGRWRSRARARPSGALMETRT
jgi:hypothetical protein